MAFRQPTFAPPRQISVPEPQQTAADTLSSVQRKGLEDSQEWVLFSPSQNQSLSQTQSVSTARTPRTTGLSRLSDFGSLNTLARSGQEHDGSDAGDDVAGEDEDEDSLDEGLHAFQEPSVDHNPRYFDQSGSILPAHDGLGTFPASSAPVQELLWHFEQHNPRKRSLEYRRRALSVQKQLDIITDDDVATVESERMARIESWRMDQSRRLLDSIEKETRRRKMSKSCGLRDQSNYLLGREQVRKDDSSFSVDRASEQVSKDIGEAETEGNETLWERIARRLIRDLLGIDDALLSIIFGESLSSEQDSHTSPAIFATMLGATGDLHDVVPNVCWDTRLLERLARELGILVQHLTDHPGAFSTPINAANIDYAGIPISVPPPRFRQETSISPLQASATSSVSPHFKPTLEAYPSRPSTSASDTTHAALWGIEEEPPTSSLALAAQDRAYWEGTPDLGNIFSVLHHRFSPPHQTPHSAPNVATTATPASLRRAAVIRQHHPLVSRAAAAAAASRRSRSTGFPHHYAHYRRTESSCKSLGVRKGARGGSGSSRNYWDLGPGSAGGSAGSALASPCAGGIGVWGEV